MATVLMKFWLTSLTIDDDSNWAGILFDATTGNVKAQIEGAYVVSASDVNNDGKYVFFCTETQGQSVPRGGVEGCNVQCGYLSVERAFSYW